MAPILGHRLYEGSPSGRTGSSGIELDVVPFLVRGQTFSAALTLQGQTLDDGSIFPNIGDPHPDFGASLQVATLVGSEVLGSGADMYMKVNAVYTRDGQSFGGIPPDDTDPNYNDYGFETKTIEITAPYFVALVDQTVILPYENAEVAYMIRYELQERVTTVAGAIYTREIVLPTFTSFAAAAILTQHDKVHTFGGLKWKFLGGSIYRSSVDQFVYAYQWLHDPGNGALDITVPLGSGTPITPPAREPFQEYFIGVAPFVGPPQGDEILPENVPYIIAQDVLADEPAGWSVLPGIGGGP